HREFQASSPNRVDIIGIGIDSPSNIRQFAAKSPVGYPLLLGGTTGHELARLFGNEKGLLPFTVIIGQDGSMMKTIVGRVRIEAPYLGGPARCLGCCCDPFYRSAPE
ncbi:MAG: hypothetical protein EBX57_11260, partial [Betaproteobacteria bacterium]|nr:hypothetical protein [Betaproteobacteria bacterium]